MIRENLFNGYFDSEFIEGTVEGGQTFNQDIDIADPRFQGLIAIFRLRYAVKEIELTGYSGVYPVFRRMIPNTDQGVQKDFHSAVYQVDTSRSTIVKELAEILFDVGYLCSTEATVVQVPSYLDKLCQGGVS
jgi:hypothetical protein